MLKRRRLISKGNKKEFFLSGDNYFGAVFSKVKSAAWYSESKSASYTLSIVGRDVREYRIHQHKSDRSGILKGLGGPSPTLVITLHIDLEHDYADLSINLLDKFIKEFSDKVETVGDILDLITPFMALDIEDSDRVDEYLEQHPVMSLSDEDVNDVPF